MLRKIVSFILIALILTSSVCAAPSSWAKAEISLARREKLIPEIIKSDYQDPITREEFCEVAIMLYEKLGGVPSEVNNSPFTDTQNPSIIAAYNLEIVKGVGEGLFAPHAHISRQEICAMLTRTLQSSMPSTTLAQSYPNIFPDMDKISDWALLPVLFINMKGIMLGDEKGNINPLDNTTREQGVILSYRLYDVLRKEVSDAIATMMFSNSGNTHANMQNGGFAIGAASQQIYTVGSDGIKTVSTSETIIDVPAKNLYAYENLFYYINEMDGGMYKHSMNTSTRLTDDKAGSFIISGKYIYYINESDGGRIYKVGTDGSENTAVTDESYALPISSGNAMYFSDGTKIVKYGPDNVSETIYERENFRLTGSNGTFYFLNEKGNLCSFKEGDEGERVLAKVPVIAFVPVSNYVVYVGEDKNMYKVDYDGLSSIRIDDGTYETVNTYNDYVFGRTADGIIYRFKIDSTDKMQIN